MVREAGVWKRDLWGKIQVELMEHTSVGVGCGASVAARSCHGLV